jgi:hypothetical protein
VTKREAITNAVLHVLDSHPWIDTEDDLTGITIHIKLNANGTPRRVRILPDIERDISVEQRPKHGRDTGTPRRS